jgi:hypothetical protein
MNATDGLLGIDIGSRTIELVVLRGGKLERSTKVPPTYDLLGQCRRVLEGVTGDVAVATGYGRKLFIQKFSSHGAFGNLLDITEIQAHAIGARALFPSARTVLDIGGQDTKVISLSPSGKATRFEMNEESGAVVVAAENCTGVKSFDLLVDETGDPIEAIARRYLRIPCSVMTPNTGRLALLDRLAREFRPHAVIDLTWHCCHTYKVESPIVEEHMMQSHGLPLLHIETDYSESDTEQLRTRVEAFLEIL